MKIFTLFIFFLLTSLFGIGIDSLSSNNLAILNSFDIDSNFIKDKKTQKLLQIYSKTRKKYFLNILENGYTYIPLIKNEINRAKIPSSLVFVAMAESYFSSKAKSRTKAMGLWQFMPATAKKFGLKINSYIDERKDPIKSTIAAIEYLTYLKRKTGKWYLSMMAYNCGEVRVIEATTRAKLDKYCESHQCKKNKTIKNYRRIIKKYQYHKGNFASLYKVYKKVNKLYPQQLSLTELLKVQKTISRQYLPKETRIYIRKIVAMSFLLNSNDFVQYQNHYLLNRGSMSNLVKVNVPSGTSLLDIAKLLNIDYKILRKNNMHLRYSFTPPQKGSYLYIPYNKLAMFRLNFKKTKMARKIIYRVKKGDTLSSIAHKYKMGYKTLKSYNHLKSDFLSLKQKLVIPLKNRLN